MPLVNWDVSTKLEETKLYLINSNSQFYNREYFTSFFQDLIIFTTKEINNLLGLKCDTVILLPLSLNKM